MRTGRMIIRNFKGIKYYEVDFAGCDTDVFGDNDKGKTTLVDAYHWCLFGKDSRNRGDFEIKPLKADGSPYHNLEHSVELELLPREGPPQVVKKVYKEKWTRKRGSAAPQHTGHTTEHFIDQVPVKAGEYNRRINTLMEEELFRLITSPWYFNEVLHWERRREILLEICGTFTDEQVIDGQPDLAPLKAILRHRTMEEHRKVLTARRKEINRELDRIPVRIDEVSRSLKSLEALEEVNPEALTARLQSLEGEAGQVREAMEAMEILTREDHRKLMEETTRLHGVERKKQRELTAGEGEEVKAARRLRDAGETHKKLENRLVELGELYQATRDAQPDTGPEAPPGETPQDRCPACGQSLPEDQVAAAREQAEAVRRQALDDYQRRKEASLTALQQEGREAKAKMEALSAEMRQLTDLVNTLQEENRRCRLALEEVQQALHKAQAQGDDIPAPAEQPQGKEALKARLAEIEKSLGEVRSRLQEVENSRAARQRILELEEMERKLTHEFEKLEGELNLTEAFVREKVRLLEHRINSQFQIARFRLFIQQQNGALAETCETTWQGVPYHSLSHSARINLGLDILNTISRHYGKSAPVFVDNAEAIVRLLPIDSQVIRLVVSKNHQELTTHVHLPGHAPHPGVTQRAGLAAHAHQGLPGCLDQPVPEVISHEHWLYENPPPGTGTLAVE